MEILKLKKVLGLECLYLGTRYCDAGDRGNKICSQNLDISYSGGSKNILEGCVRRAMEPESLLEEECLSGGRNGRS